MSRLLRTFAVPLLGSRLVFSRIGCLALYISFLVPVSLVASDGFQPVSSEELKMTSEPLAPGAPAVILYRRVDRVDSPDSPHEFNYVRIKVLTQEGRKYADIEIPFDKESGFKIVKIGARTIKPDGSISEFTGDVYDKSLVKAKGLRIMAKTFTLPDAQVGSIIEYYYTLNLPGGYLYASNWILDEELFTKSADFSLYPYSYMNVRWGWRSLPPGTEQPKQEKDRIIRLHVKNVPAFQTEDFMPPLNEVKSRVDFTYESGKVEKDEAEFWKNTGKRYDAFMEEFVSKRKAMDHAVADIVLPSDSPEMKLQKIYARVQEIHNTSYEPDKTRQQRKREGEKELSDVEDVWKRGYGGDWQINWLFLALVRAAGFDAHAVWASGRYLYFFQPYLRDARKLDGSLVLVKINGQDAYFDPGAAFTPYGLLPWPYTGVQGRRLDKEGGAWVRTTVPEPSASHIERKATLTLSDTGDLEGKLTITFTGLEALQRRSEQNNEDDAHRKKFLEEQVQEYIPAASEVDLTNRPDWNSASPSLVAEFKVKIPGWVSGAGRRELLPVGIFTASEKGVFDRAQRVHPIYFQFSFEKLDDVTIAMPLGWQIGTLPAAQKQDGKVVAYASAAENDHGTLHLTRKLSLDLMLVDVKYYAALRQFFQEVRKSDEAQVVLQPISASSR